MTQLTYEEALGLNEQIKANSRELAKLIRTAWAGKIWLALGQTSFEAWLEDTLGYGRARGYQLIATANLEDEVRAVMPLPDTFSLTERVARLIIRMGVPGTLVGLEAAATTDEAANETAFYAAVAALRAVEATLGAETPTDSAEPAEALPAPAYAALDALGRKLEDIPEPSEVTTLIALETIEGNLTGFIARALELQTRLLAEQTR